jgi:phosphate/sulfate permease
MLNVTIFALPLSATHIVFSGLTAVSIFFLNFIMEDIKWLLLEFISWILSPIICISITYGMYHYIQRHIFERADAKKRVLKFIPFQVSFTFSFMLLILIAKDVSIVSND